MSLERLMKMAESLVAEKETVADITEQLATHKSHITQLEQEEIPELMREIGMSSVTLSTGETLEMVDEISCGITKANGPKAHAWLIENGFGGLIKTKVSVAFDPEDQAQAVLLGQKIADDGFSAKYEEAVHPATLKSFIKEQLADGTAVPFDLFGVHPYSKIKFAKKRK